MSFSDFFRSDPTENDSVEGLRPNARGPGLVTFGVGAFYFSPYVVYVFSPFRTFSFLVFTFCFYQPDRVMEFCNNNDLQLIVRAHECVMDGFERFAQGHLITLFSATNYCGEMSCEDLSFSLLNTSTHNLLTWMHTQVLQIMLVRSWFWVEILWLCQN